MDEEVAASPTRPTPPRRGLSGFLAVVLLLVGAVAAIGASRAISYFNTPVVQETADTRDTRVIQSITREEQIVLLSLGIQGITERSQATKIFGKEIPGSERVVFVQYSFNAKLGIEGKDVTIKQTGDTEYLVTIPEFIFIGHNNQSFKLVAENNGVLSFVTSEIDPVQMINGILNDEAKDAYVSSNREVLQDKARGFYTAIIQNIDPNVTVKFAFDNR